MQHKKTVTIPARTQEQVDHYTCDLCGKKDEGGDWAKRTHEVLETTIELKDGTSYPDGGSSTRTKFDICPGCFKTKLVPWFESQGAKPRTEETDW